MQKPTIGRIVMFNAGLEKDPDLRAAIIVQVHNETCINLKIFGRNSS